MFKPKGVCFHRIHSRTIVNGSYHSNCDSFCFEAQIVQQFKLSLLCTQREIRKDNRFPSKWKGCGNGLVDGNNSNKSAWSRWGIFVYSFHGLSLKLNWRGLDHELGSISWSKKPRKDACLHLPHQFQRKSWFCSLKVCVELLWRSHRRGSG